MLLFSVSRRVWGKIWISTFLFNIVVDCKLSLFSINVILSLSTLKKIVLSKIRNVSCFYINRIKRALLPVPAWANVSFTSILTVQTHIFYSDKTKIWCGVKLYWYVYRLSVISLLPCLDSFSKQSLRSIISRKDLSLCWSLVNSRKDTAHSFIFLNKWVDRLVFALQQCHLLPGVSSTDVSLQRAD